jgi:hypothetical protein
MKLVVDMNPNILELLWVDESDIITTTPAYTLLRSYREQLLSSKAKFTFSGYAFSQLKRIKGHNKWINKPIEDKPRQVNFLKCIHSLDDKFTKNDFNKIINQTGVRLLTLDGNTLGLYQVGRDYKVYNHDDGSLNLMNDDNDKAIKASGNPLFIVKYNKQEFNHQLDQYREYQRWKKNRNKDRSALEVAHGYDTKHAMHLIRLYRMGIEILTEGQVKVKRPDAEELLQIRDGALTYDELIKEVEGLDQKLDDAYNNTTLRRSVDLNEASNILIDLYDNYWANK